MKRLKKMSITILVCIVFFAVYTFYITRNLTNMTTKQKVLKVFYPALMWITKLTGTNTSNIASNSIQPPISFYSLQTTLSDGSTFNFAALKGKKVLLVNTASDCGYTDQYADLEKLYQQYKVGLEIIAFPANDFKEQEKGTDEEIASFCKKNFGVSFLLMKKSSVIKGADQNKIFEWLTDSTKNGWNNQQPSWNFCKFIVDEQGRLTNFFGSTIEPLGEEVKAALNQ